MAKYSLLTYTVKNVLQTIASVFEVYPKNLKYQLFIVLTLLTNEICYFLKKWPNTF